MALVRANMHRTNVGPINVWYYKTTDANAALVTDGYFDAMGLELREHDLIYAIDTTNDLLEILKVNTADYATDVTVTNVNT